MVLVQIKTTPYEGDFQNRLVYAPPAELFVSSVGLDLAVGPLGLDRTVHAEQRPVDAVEISQHFLFQSFFPYPLVISVGLVYNSYL